MRGIYKFYQLCGTGLVALLVLWSAQASASMWLSQTDPASGCRPNADSPDRTFYIVNGKYPHGVLHPSTDIGNEDAAAFVVDMQGHIRDVPIDGGTIRLRAPLESHHWLFYQHRELHGDTLHVVLAKYRFYNKYGDVGESILKEMRGRTIDSKYGRPPVKAVPFEIILQKPLSNHHISCCMYSGDTVRLKVFHNQQPLPHATVKVFTETGWNTVLHAGTDNLVSFEIPRNTYVDMTKDKYHKEHMLIVADYTLKAAGSFQGKPYQRIHYRMTRRVDFGPSPLEWAAKMPAFLLVFAVIFVCGFGIFLYRLWIKKHRLEWA